MGSVANPKREPLSNRIDNTPPRAQYRASGKAQQESNMITLTSAQEAAFNAAGEALIDLGFRADLGFSPDFLEDGPHFTCTGKDPQVGEYMCGSGPTLAEAVTAFALKSNEKLADGRKLRTAKETIEAVKSLLNEEDPLRAKLDELPVA
jgi:hypothetical protein